MAFRGGLSNAAITFTDAPTTGLTAGQQYAYPAQRVQANFASGTAADQIDGVFEEQISLSASTPQTVNLFTQMVDLLGNAITPARLRFVAIKVLSVVDGAVLTVGNAVTNEFDGFLTSGSKALVYPSSAGNDGFTIWSAPNTTGMPITSTTCNLKLDPGTNAMTVILIAASCSV